MPDYSENYFDQSFKLVVLQNHASPEIQIMQESGCLCAFITDTHVVREGGLEPPRPFDHWHLKPARLPFRHSRE